MTRIRKGLIATTLSLAALDGALPREAESNTGDPAIGAAWVNPGKDRDPRLLSLGNGDSAAEDNSDEA